MSAADLIAHAEATSHQAIPGVPAAPAAPRSSGWTRRWLLVGASAGLAVAVGVYALSAGGPSGPVQAPQPNPVAAGVVLQPIAYEIEDDAPPAGDYLRSLAADLAEAPYEHSDGEYAYHHIRSWGALIAYSPEGHALAHTLETQTWQRDDGSGLQRTTQVGVEFPDEASRDYWTARQPDGYGPSGPVDTSLDGAVPNAPLPSDYAGLVQRLKADVEPGVGKAIASVYAEHVVPLATRAAILTVLADLPGWSWRGEVTDRAGRDGVAVTFNDPEHNQEQLLIFDPATGVLLAHELVTLGDSRVTSYTLILETDRRAEIS